MNFIGFPLARGKDTFVIPVGAGAYAPEKITLKTSTVVISAGRIAIETVLPAGAIIEAWILKDGGDPNNDNDFFFVVNALSAAAQIISQNLYSPAIQYRAKSGGTAGNIIGHALGV